jgi:hypothetical protein
MNPILRARFLRRSAGMLMGLAGARRATIDAESARRRMTCSVRRSRPAAHARVNTTPAASGHRRIGGRP